MTLIITLVGDLGGGKTSVAKALGLVVKAALPRAPVISNVEMGSGIMKVDDVHKWIAIKLLKKDKRYACVIDDEAAQAGLESRGSGSKAAAVESRIITHARKAHIDLILISQLKSMLDKRVQWVEDFSILCEAIFDQGNVSARPDFFQYTIYNKAFEVINDFEIDTDDMEKYVWPGMDTDDIPFFESFKRQFTSYWDIREEDMGNWEESMDMAMAKVP